MALLPRRRERRLRGVPQRLLRASGSVFVPDEEMERSSRGRAPSSDLWSLDIFRGVFAPHADGMTAGRLPQRLALLRAEDVPARAPRRRGQAQHGPRLETRVPFLDNALVDFAHPAAAALKVPAIWPRSPSTRTSRGSRAARRGRAKPGQVRSFGRRWSACCRPRRHRGEAGFSAPDASWFRGESIEYINRLLVDPRPGSTSSSTPSMSGGSWTSTRRGKVNRRLLIWSLLSFEWWCRSFLEAFPARTHGELYAVV